MVRVLTISILLVALACVTTSARETEGWISLGLSGGAKQPMGGDNDYEAPGLTIGLQLKRPMSENLSIALDYAYAKTGADRPSVAFAQPARGFESFGAGDYYSTVWNHLDLSLVYDFSPEASVNPFVSGGLGLSFWGVQDWTDAASRPGETPEGYNTDGRRELLRGTNFSAALGAGVEFFASEKLSFSVGGRYRYLLLSDLDNTGPSAEFGPNYVDANSGALEGFVGLTYYFGPNDCDGDGVFDHLDQCFREREDFDNFEDGDGCPDIDNDADGILDVDDECPDEAEDFDDFEDEDGCPEVDTDGDGIMDRFDACPEEPEDMDSFEDQDGCPDPDNDGDGVLDGMDDCPDTPMGVEVDGRGCEVKQPEFPGRFFMLQGVLFELDSARLLDETKVVLDDVLRTLTENPDVTVEIGGHACDLGTDDHNNKLSGARALAVKHYLVRQGIDADRMTTVGYGESRPAFPNNTPESREKNRRVVFTRTDQ